MTGQMQVIEKKHSNQPQIGQEERQLQNSAWQLNMTA